MAIAATIAVDLVARTEAFNKAMQGVGDKLEGVGDTLKDAGKGMSTFVTGPIVGVGAAAFAAAVSVNNAMADIVKSTGASGEMAASLEESFRKVARTVPNSLAEVAAALGDVNTRTGMTGTELETITRKMLDFARVTDSDTGRATRSLSQLMNALELDMAQLPEVMDKLLFASQASGIGALDLAEGITQAGTAFIELGFPLDKSIALFSQFEKVGARPTDVIATLNRALTRFAQDGATNAEEAFSHLLAAIAGAPTRLEATAIAADAFGARFGDKIAEEVRGGTFAVDDFVQALQGTSGLLDSTAVATLKLGDEMAMMRNQTALAVSLLGQPLVDAVKSLRPAFESALNVVTRIITAFGNLPGPVQTGILVFLGLLAAIGPVLLVAGSLVGMLGTLVSAVGPMVAAFGVLSTFITGTMIPAFVRLTAVMLANPFTAIAVVLGLLAGAFIYAYTTSDEFREKVHNLIERLGQFAQSIRDRFGAALTWLADTFNATKTAVGNAVSDFVTDFVTAMTVTLPTAIRDKIGSLLDWLTGAFVTPFANVVTRVTGFVTDFLAGIQKLRDDVNDRIGGMLTWLTGAFTTPFSGIVTRVNSFVTDVLDGLAKKIPDDVKDKIGGMLTWLSGAFTSPFSGLVTRINTFVTDVLNGLAKKLPDDVKKAIGDMLIWLSGAFTSPFSGLVTRINTFVTDVLNGLAKKLPDDVKKAIGDMLTWFTGAFTNPFRDVLTRVSDFVKDALEWLAKKLPDDVRTKIGDLFSFLTTTFGKLADIKTAVTDFASDAVTRFGTLRDGVTDRVTTTMSTVTTGFRDAFDNVSDRLTGFVSRTDRSLGTDWTGTVSSATTAFGLNLTLGTKSAVDGTNDILAGLRVPNLDVGIQGSNQGAKDALYAPVLSASADTAKAMREAAKAYEDALKEGARLGTLNNKEVGDLLGRLVSYRQELESGELPLERRNELTRAYNDLLEGSKRALEISNREIQTSITATGKHNAALELVPIAIGDVRLSMGDLITAVNATKAEVTSTKTVMGLLRTATDSARGALSDVFDSISDKGKKALGDFFGQLSPTSLAMEALGGVFEALKPILEVMREPFRAIGEIIGRALMPVLIAFWPIVRELAIAFSVAAEIVLFVVGGFARGVGGVIAAIGNAIAKIPFLGGIGRNIAGTGETISNVGKAFMETGNEMKNLREVLRSINFDSTAQQTQTNDLLGVQNATSAMVAANTERMANKLDDFEQNIAININAKNVIDDKGLVAFIDDLIIDEVERILGEAVAREGRRIGDTGFE
jgi:TP901 family phage tail tape measure protein